MHNAIKLFLVISLSTSFGNAFAYGTGQSSHSCEKPIFSAFQPAANKYLQSFNEFSFVTTGNTAPTSIAVSVSVVDNKFHFTHKDLVITTLKNGHLAVKGKLGKPVEHGFARIDFTAHIKPGCDKTEGYLIRIQ